MSKATKRKHVTKEVLEEYYVPENGEEIVKVCYLLGCFHSRLLLIFFAQNYSKLI